MADLQRLQWQELAPPGSRNRKAIFYYVSKRLMDLVLGCAFLILFTPLMLLTAILIKLDSPGPAFFVQPRAGSRRRSTGGRDQWDVRIFSCYKFRSMQACANPTVHINRVREFVEGQELLPGVNSRYKLGNDARVTRVGRILRRTSIDELPQLFNVLKGEMSLVGPRPVPTYEVGLYKERHYERLAALPGMTGLWQTKGRGIVSFEEMVRMDVEYVRNASPWLDLKCLLLTIPAVLCGRGAE